MQIVEGRVGRRRRHDLGSKLRQGVGKSQKPAIGGADGQDVQSNVLNVGRSQRDAMLTKSGLTQDELLICHRGASHLLQSQRRLRRVRRLGQRQIAPVHAGSSGLAYAQDRQIASIRRAPQSLDLLSVELIHIDHCGIDRHVREHQQGRIKIPGGHGPPPQPIQPLAQGIQSVIKAGDDQNARVGKQAKSPGFGRPPPPPCPNHPA